MATSRTVTRTANPTSTIKRQPASTSRAYAPHSSNKRAPEYRVDIIESNGIKTEVLTIEDTPEPIPGSSKNQYSHSRYEDSYANEPVAKKRKSDGTHISDQPYPRKRKAEGEPSSHTNGRNESGSSQVSLDSDPLQLF